MRRIRRVNLTSGVVFKLAGGGSAGSANGQGTSATFNNPQGIAMDSTGSFALIVSGLACLAVCTSGSCLTHSLPSIQADTNNHLIRKLTMSSGDVLTLAGGNGATVSGSSNGDGTSATFSLPYDVAVDAAGTFAVVVSSTRPFA